MTNIKNIDVLDSAFEYREMGLSVIRLDGKKPVDAWKELQKRLPTTGEILSWFGAVQKRQWNIGIVTGSVSGVVAVDVDSQEMARWAWNNLPRTEMMTRSGNGRGHLYYRLPNGVHIGNRVRINGKPIDLRDEGGQCVAPPSIHPETGEQYQKVGSWHLLKVPEFPVDWIDSEPVHISIALAEATRKIHTRGTRVTDLMAYCLKVPSIQGENGSKGCFRVACLCRDHGYGSEQAFQFMQEWQAQSPLVEPKWSDKELWHKIEDAYVKDGKEKTC